MMTCYDTGINWMWYIDVTVNPDDTVTIHKHYRMHKYRDDAHPTATLSYRLIEDSDRIVRSIQIGSKTHLIANPQHVFSYN